MTSGRNGTQPNPLQPGCGTSEGGGTREGRILVGDALERLHSGRAS